MPWWSQPVADEDPPAEHVHFPAERRFGCWTCSCGEVYEPQDVRKQLQPKKRQRPLARISDSVRVRGVRFRELTERGKGD